MAEQQIMQQTAANFDLEIGALNDGKFNQCNTPTCLAFIFMAYSVFCLLKEADQYSVVGFRLMNIDMRN
jgi:hypothetical protein